MSVEVTRVVELTPPGRGAVAVVLVAGPAAVAAVERCFESVSGRTLAKTPLNAIILGRWRGEAIGESPEQSSAPSEDVIVCHREIDLVEVHCHGGAMAVRTVIGALVELGCQRCPWQEWIQRDESDSIRAAARIALADAATARTAEILLDQYQGALTAALEAIVEDVASQQWEAAAARAKELLANRDLGLHLTSPWQVVLAGRPNVGKSSLLNALAGFQRAIVSATPGTTRDVVTFATAIDGWWVQLADTAGLREATDELEAAGVGLAGRAIAAADLVIVVHDATNEPGLQNELTAARVLHVFNKIDLVGAKQRAAHASRVMSEGTPAVLTSAVSSKGVSDLISAIGQTLVPRPPAARSAVPFTTEQIATLERLERAIGERDAAAAKALLQALLAR